MIAVPGAVGFLYLLRDAGALGYGPDVAGALPLRQLARTDRQPLLRLAVAWLPAGVLVGVALRRAGVPPAMRVGGTAAVAAVWLLPLGAVSDAVTVSGPLSTHLTPQLSRAGTWVGVTLMALGVAAVRGSRPGTPAAPSGP